MLTEKDITEICSKICADAGYEFTIPVRINKRLTSTLGRVKYIVRGGRCYNESMEFSYKFLDSSSLDDIMNVIKHECAHYLTTAETQEHHGHDQVFKAMCARIGCVNDKTFYTGGDLTDQYKYVITCQKCHKNFTRSRKCKITEHPEDYQCKCGGPLYVVQNW